MRVGSLRQEKSTPTHTRAVIHDTAITKEVPETLFQSRFLELLFYFTTPTYGSMGVYARGGETMLRWVETYGMLACPFGGGEAHGWELASSAAGSCKIVKKYTMCLLLRGLNL